MRERGRSERQREEMRFHLELGGVDGEARRGRRRPDRRRGRRSEGKGERTDSSRRRPPSTPPSVRRERSSRRSSLQASIYAGRTGTPATSSTGTAEREELATEKRGSRWEEKGGMGCGGAGERVGVSMSTGARQEGVGAAAWGAPAWRQCLKALWRQEGDGRFAKTPWHNFINCKEVQQQALAI